MLLQQVRLVSILLLPIFGRTVLVQQNDLTFHITNMTTENLKKVQPLSQCLCVLYSLRCYNNILQYCMIFMYRSQINLSCMLCIQLQHIFKNFVVSGANSKGENSNGSVHTATLRRPSYHSPSPSRPQLRSDSNHLNNIYTKVSIMSHEGMHGRHTQILLDVRLLIA